VTGDLGGAQILVTRPAAQAEPLCRLIEQHGGKPLRFPTLAIAAIPVDPKALENAMASDWLIFTSTNAVRYAVQALAGRITELKSKRIAAVGKATAAALEQAALHLTCLPDTDFSSEGLLAQSSLRDVAGQRIVIVRGQGGREVITQELTARGAHVTCLELYRRHAPTSDNRAIQKTILDGNLDATTITSGEALQNLLTMLTPETLAKMHRLPLLVVSSRIAEQARHAGFQSIAVTAQASDSAILETLTMLFTGENSGRRH